MAIGVIVTAIVLSSCTVNVTPPTPTPQTYYPYVDQSTGWLNCAGWTVTGEYYAAPFSLLNPGTFEITAWSNDLPPSNFDVLIMTSDQYDIFVQMLNNGAGQINNFPFLYDWDLTTTPSLYGYQFYLDEIENLAAGNYYVVFFNNYEQFGAGYYGNATFDLTLTSSIYI
ncbi:MAG: hypothetical protein QW046_03400 [Candidatus Micrarchaeaceae archaeon]